MRDARAVRSVSSAHHKAEKTGLPANWAARGVDMTPQSIACARPCADQSAEVRASARISWSIWCSMCSSATS
jgi:hypothetical protein